MLTKHRKKIAIKKTQEHGTDTGSLPVQIMLLTKKINELTKHLEDNKKDSSSRRGLVKMIHDRRTFLNTLKKDDLNKYNDIIEKAKLKK